MPGKHETISTTINGVHHSLIVEPATPAVYVLRNELHLLGVRIGCGQGHCGACMILVDGIPTRSCEFPIEAANNRTITTVEGLGSAEWPHPVQQAILDEQAGQCGYCLNGIIISASALPLNSLSQQEIAKALDKHLCRCGSHNRIIRAISLAICGATDQ